MASGRKEPPVLRPRVGRPEKKDTTEEVEGEQQDRDSGVFTTPTPGPDVSGLTQERDELADIPEEYKSEPDSHPDISEDDQTYEADHQGLDPGHDPRVDQGAGIVDQGAEVADQGVNHMHDDFMAGNAITSPWAKHKSCGRCPKRRPRLRSKTGVRT